MSVPYGMPASGAYQPPGRVNFGWIGESYTLFGKAAGIWVLGILLYGILNNIVDGILVHSFPNPNYVSPPGPFGESIYRFGIQYGTNSNVTAIGQVLGLLFMWLYGSFQSASLYHVAVKQVRGQNVAFGDLFSGGSYFGAMLLLNVALTALYVLGIFALCIGVFVVSAFFLPVAALVADGRTAGQALSESAGGMKKDWLSAILFVFVGSLLITASVLPCGLGLFVTIPMAHLVAALAYRDMIGMPGVIQAAPAYGAAAPGVWPPAPSSAPPPPQWGSPADAPPAYPGYVPQPSSPPAPPLGTPPAPPQSYPSVPAQQYPSVEPTVFPPPETPTELPPALPPPADPQSPWSPRPSPPPQGE